jgi:hypothetical protein
MMWIVIPWANVMVGVKFALLGESERFLPYAVGKWFSSLRDFLADSKFTLGIINTCTRHIIFMHWHGGGSSDIQAINRCRLYLQVECLSDACTADGLSIDPGLQVQPITSKSTIQVAMVRPSWSTLVGSMAPIPQTIYTRFIDQSATPNLMLVDATRPLYSACILRTIITTALPDRFPNSKYTA